MMNKEKVHGHDHSVWLSQGYIEDSKPYCGRFNYHFGLFCGAIDRLPCLAGDTW